MVYIVIIISVIVWFFSKNNICMFKPQKNFVYSEFYNDKYVNGIPLQYHCNLNRLAEKLQFIRDKFGEPIKVNSAYRDVEHNHKVGGVSNSHHLKCAAADITPLHFSKESFQRLKSIVLDNQDEFGQIGVYSDRLHISIFNGKSKIYYA